MTGFLPSRLSAETPTGIVGTVSGGHFLSHLFFVSFPPLFPLLFAEFDVTYTQLGLLVSSLYAAMFVFQIPFGWFVDRGYAKFTLVGGLVLTAGGVIGASLATSYPTLLAATFVSGIGQATFHPADYALLDTVSAADGSGRAFGIHTFAGYAGSGVAPVLVGSLGLWYGWRVPLLAIGLVGVVYAAVVGIGVEPVYANELKTADLPIGESSVADTVRTFLRPSIVAMFLFFVVIIVAESGIQSFTVVFLVETYGIDESTGNGALTAFFALAAGGVLLGGVLADRYDAGKVIVVCLGVAAALTLVLTLGLVPETAAVSVALFGCIGFAYGVVMPSRDRLVAAYSPEQSVGTSFGLVFTGAAVGGSIGPVLIGLAIDHRGITMSMLLVGIFFVVGAGIVALMTVRSSA